MKSLNCDGFDALRLLTTSSFDFYDWYDKNARVSLERNHSNHCLNCDSCDFYDCYDNNTRASQELNHSNHRNQINHSSDRSLR